MIVPFAGGRNASFYQSAAEDWVSTSKPNKTPTEEATKNAPLLPGPPPVFTELSRPPLRSDDIQAGSLIVRLSFQTSHKEAGVKCSRVQCESPLSASQ